MNFTPLCYKPIREKIMAIEVKFETDGPDARSGIGAIGSLLQDGNVPLPWDRKICAWWQGGNKKTLCEFEEQHVGLINLIPTIHARAMDEYYPFWGLDNELHLFGYYWNQSAQYLDLGAVPESIFLNYFELAKDMLDSKPPSEVIAKARIRYSEFYLSSAGKPYLFNEAVKLLYVNREALVPYVDWSFRPKIPVG